MTIDIADLFKNKYSKLRIKITKKLRKKLFFYLGNLTESLSQSLKINEVSLRRKLFDRRGYSFKFKELLFLAEKAKISKKEVISNITDIKLGSNAYWANFPMRISVDEEFVEGIGYYVGDGRLKTNKGLSTTNTDIETVKFFINWLKKYFNAKIEDIRINISLPCSDFNVNLEKRKWSKLLKADINSVKEKYKYEDYHKAQIEILYSRRITKLVLDKLIPRIKERCLINKSFATAYIRGIMAAEGSPRWNEKSHQRAIHLKMKNKKEVKNVFKLLQFLDFTPGLLFSRHDKEWIVTIGGFYELKRLEGMNVFKLNSAREEKLKRILSNYHRRQAKKGLVREFYLSKLFEFERKYGRYCTAKQLSKYIKRDKTRAIKVLRELQKDRLVSGERIMKIGTPFKFTLTKAGQEFISK